MVTLNSYEASSIKARNIWHEKPPPTTFFLLILGHSSMYNAAWIQRLEEFGWNLLLKESADMKFAMYDQHVEY